MKQSSVKQADQLFAINGVVEIRSLIRRLIDNRCMFTVHINGGAESFLSAILDVDVQGQTFLLDASYDTAMNAHLAEAQTLLFHTQIDQVEVRFRTGPVAEVSLNNLLAFRVDFPEQIYYLQQREFFRLRVPTAMPLYCEIALPTAETAAPSVDGETMLLKLPVVDIGVGGVALSLTPAQAAWFEVDATLAHCWLALPDSGPINPHLRVCHVSRAAEVRGVQRVQVGCQFIEPAGTMQAIIQRYIMRVDRERMARDRGMI